MKRLRDLAIATILGFGGGAAAGHWFLPPRVVEDVKAIHADAVKLAEDLAAQGTR